MASQKSAKDLMIRLEDYPHIPYWFSLRQAIAIVREASLKLQGQFEPRAVLVFDEKYQLMGMLTLRDIVIGLEPKFLRETNLIKMDPNLAVLAGELLGPKLREQSQTAVGEVMSPIRATVEAAEPITKALYLMIKENVGLIPVMQNNKVVGMLRLSDLFAEISNLVLAE